eukprot:237627-Chlamydomonas_euryale.AAC.1
MTTTITNKDNNTATAKPLPPRTPSLPTRNSLPCTHAGDCVRSQPNRPHPRLHPSAGPAGRPAAAACHDLACDTPDPRTCEPDHAHRNLTRDAPSLQVSLATPRPARTSEPVDVCAHAWELTACSFLE